MTARLVPMRRRANKRRNPTDHAPIHWTTAVFGCIAALGFIILGAHYGLPL